MRIEPGAPVIGVTLPAGLGDSLYHLPATHRRIPGPRPHRLPLTDTVSPDSWPTLCRLEGLVYRYAGAIRDRRLCTVCRDHAPAPALLEDGSYSRAPLQPRTGRAQSPLKREHLELLYRVKYQGEGLGTLRIGELIWQRFGYPSAKTAGAAVYRGFLSLGFEMRSQPEATALKNYRHGRRRRELGESGPAVTAYRAWLRDERGDRQPACAGVRSTAPGKGKPCTRPAMRGSVFCWSHDPSRHGERVEQCAAMRAKVAEIPTVDWQDVAAALGPWLACQQHPAAALVHESGVKHCYTLLAGKYPRIEEETAGRLLAVVGLTVDDLYRQEQAA